MSLVRQDTESEVTIPSLWASRGGRDGGSAPYFRQKIIDLMVTKAVHSRGPHGSGQFRVMVPPRLLKKVTNIVGVPLVKDISMAQCKTAVSPVLTHWRYCSFALNYGFCITSLFLCIIFVCMMLILLNKHQVLNL